MEVHVASKVIIAHPEKDEILLVKRSMDHASLGIKRWPYQYL